jgi:hypothetical protein
MLGRETSGGMRFRPGIIRTRVRVRGKVVPNHRNALPNCVFPRVWFLKTIMSCLSRGPFPKGPKNEKMYLNKAIRFSKLPGTQESAPAIQNPPARLIHPCRSPLSLANHLGMAKSDWPRLPLSVDFWRGVTPIEYHFRPLS